MHDRTRKPASSVNGNRLGRRLLQSLVGEQPVRGIVELHRGLTAQYRRLHQHGRPIAETFTRPSDVGNQGGRTQAQGGNVAQRLPADIAAQIGDVVGSEIYDGLTPVTITL
jgi:hypothetical protein